MLLSFISVLFLFTFKSKMTNIVGIDLGTTNTCISHLRNKIPKILPLKGKNTIPSTVKIDNQTIFAIKRLIGQKFTDIKQFISNLPYKTIPHINNDVWLLINNKKISPVDVSSRILRNVKELAEKQIGNITDVVITVPAYFNESQRQATKDAGKIAGFNVLRVINEPTAAALAYGLDKTADNIVAVYDLGGGTFDISILEIRDGIFEVLSTNGNNQLGGEDIDNEIRKSILHRFEKENNIKLTPESKQIVKEHVEEMKKQLSYTDEYTIKIDNLLAVDNTLHKIKYTYKVDEIENIVRHIVEKTIEPCINAIKDSKLTKDKIKRVILVGGSTRMPMVRKIVSKIFGKEPETGVDPDEVVAKGAAIQCGILKGVYNDIILLDVASLSLGIETIGGFFSKIINRNDKLPCKVSQTFTTSEDNQKDVEIKIYQGERPLVKFNKFLSEIKLFMNNKMKKGEPRIEVTFDGDANGIFKVTAKDMITGKENRVDVKPASGLTEEEIERIVEEANEREDYDKLLVECIKIRDIVKNMKKQGFEIDKIEEKIADETFDTDLVKKMINEIIKDV